MDLSQLSDSELREEMDRRKLLKKYPKPDPVPFDQINWLSLYESALGYVLAVENNTNRDDDGHYIMEEVIGLVYPKQIWTYMNKCCPLVKEES